MTALVFERLIARYNQFDPRRGSLEGWFFSIARHALYNQSRHNSRHSYLELDENLEDVRNPEPTDQVLQQEELKRLHRYIGQLGERDRELIALRFGAGLHYRRIGELLHISEANATVALSRALKRLRALFETDEK